MMKLNSIAYEKLIEEDIAALATLPDSPERHHIEQVLWWSIQNLYPGNMESRVQIWVETRIGPQYMHRRERAMRLLEEAIELAQAEGIPLATVAKQVEYVYARPAGNPEHEAGGVAITLLAYCAAINKLLGTVTYDELRRIEAKSPDEIRGSITRKQDADIMHGQF